MLFFAAVKTGTVAKHFPG